MLNRGEIKLARKIFFICLDNEGPNFFKKVVRQEIKKEQRIIIGHNDVFSFLRAITSK